MCSMGLCLTYVDLRPFGPTYKLLYFIWTPGAARVLRANVKPVTCATRKRKAGLIGLHLHLREDRLGGREKSRNLPRPGKRGFVEEDNAPGNVALVKLVNRGRHH